MKAANITNPGETNFQAANTTEAQEGPEILQVFSDFAYLAIDDSVIIDKTFEKDGVLGNYSFCDTEFYIHVESSTGVLTTLITYDDEDVWDDSLQKKLTDLFNEGEVDLIFNATDLIFNALSAAGFTGGLIEKMIFDIVYDESASFYIRTADFAMNNPADDVHPGFDT